MGKKFNVWVHNGSERTVEERDYSDINYVNYWIDNKGNPIYRVYLLNGESFFAADNQDFSIEHVPNRVNAINKVRRKKYLYDGERIRIEHVHK